MDETTRGYLEKFLDNAIKDLEVRPIRWIEEEIPLSSFRDFALGNAIGELRTLCTIPFLTKRHSEREAEEIYEAIRVMVKRRLPEIIAIIEKELNR